LLRVWGDPGHRELIGEIRARLDRGTVPQAQMLRVEWLRLQNPRAQFPVGRAVLPGQEHPGLGMLRDVVALLLLACERLHLDGVLYVPARYHIAAQARAAARFLDPAIEGRFRAVQSTLAGLSLAAASQAVEEGRLVDVASGTPYEWQPAPLIIPLTTALRARLESAEYEQAMATAERAARFQLLATF
jgi:hypothetical protein